MGEVEIIRWIRCLYSIGLNCRVQSAINYPRCNVKKRVFGRVFGVPGIADGTLGWTGHLLLPTTSESAVGGRTGY